MWILMFWILNIWYLLYDINNIFNIFVSINKIFFKKIKYLLLILILKLNIKIYIKNNKKLTLEWMFYMFIRWLKKNELIHMLIKLL